METDQDRLIERRRNIAAVTEDFRPHDQALLARLPPGALADQRYARHLLHQHSRAVWEHAKTSGLNPAIQPHWISVAMLCDLTPDLRSTACSAGPWPP
jgi:hypothetical protein